MKNKHIIKKINSQLLQKGGTMKPFVEQLLEYEYGLYPKDTPLVVSDTTPQLNNAEIEPHPITINQSTINKIKNKHDVPKGYIMRIENMLKNNVLIITSRNKTTPNSLVVVTDCMDDKDRPIVIIIRKDYRIGYKFTNNIASMYGRNNFEHFLEGSYQDGCKFYTNEKTERWLSSQRLQLSPDVARVLFCKYDISNKAVCQEPKGTKYDKKGKEFEKLEERISSAKKRSDKNNKDKKQNFKSNEKSR